MPESVVPPSIDKTSKGFQPPQLINFVKAAITKWVRVRFDQLKAAAKVAPKAILFIVIGLVCIVFEGE